MAGCAAEADCTWFEGYQENSDESPIWTWYDDAAVGSAVPDVYGTVHSQTTEEATVNTDDSFEWVGTLTTLTPAEDETEDTDETTEEETEAASYLTMGFAAAAAVIASMF